MKTPFTVLILMLLAFNFSGCSHKTDFRMMVKAQDTQKRYSSASVLVVADDIDSISDGDEGIVEDLEEEISDELSSLGIKLGGDLQIKIIIDHYEHPCLMCSGGITAIDGNVMLSHNHAVISEFEIKYKLNNSDLSSTFVFKDAKEAFIEKLMEHLKENYLSPKEN